MNQCLADTGDGARAFFFFRSLPIKVVANNVWQAMCGKQCFDVHETGCQFGGIVKH